MEQKNSRKSSSKKNTVIEDGSASEKPKSKKSETAKKAMAVKTVKKTDGKAKTTKSTASSEKKKASKAKAEKSSAEKPEVVDDTAFATDEDLNLDSPLDPLVQKLLDYAKNKQVVSWDEITEILSADFVNSPRMEEVLQLLSQNNIQVMEETDSLLDEEEEEEERADDEGDVTEEISVESKIDENGRHKLVDNGDKDSSIDDPIRLYLREIGKENLLTAEQEVTLSKKMEDGQNIIKNVINFFHQ